MVALLRKIIVCMKLKGIISESEEDVYYFGLECLLIKLIHYSSYMLIGALLRMLIPMLISAIVLIPLRRKSGGFHARTRIGCYLISCFVVVVVCLLDKVIFPLWLGAVTTLGANAIIFAFAPIENENRILDYDEKKKFRKQTLMILTLADIAIIISYKNHIEVCQWLLNGMLVAAMLNLAGEIQTKRKGGYLL